MIRQLAREAAEQPVRIRDRLTDWCRVGAVGDVQLGCDQLVGQDQAGIAPDRSVEERQQLGLRVGLAPQGEGADGPGVGVIFPEALAQGALIGNPHGARRKRERSDSGMDWRWARLRQVLIRIPERTIVHGIDAHTGIVTPPGTPGLTARATEENGFRLHDPQEIGGNPTREADRWKYRGTRNAIPQCNVARSVHCDAAHPAMLRVGAKRALLVNGWSGGSWIPYFIPPNPCDTAARVHRMIDH